MPIPATSPITNRSPSPTDLPPPAREVASGSDAAQVVGGISKSTPIRTVPNQPEEGDAERLSSPPRSTLQAPAQVGEGLELKRASSKMGGFLSRSRSSSAMGDLGRRISGAFSPTRGDRASATNTRDASTTDRHSSDRESLTSAGASDPKLPPQTSSRAGDSRSSDTAQAPTLSLREALTSEATRISLQTFMQGEYNDDSFMFMSNCNDLANDIATERVGRDILKPQQHEALAKIVNDFINPKGTSSINIVGTLIQGILAAWDEVDNQPVGARNYVPFFFQLDKAVDEILKLVARDTYKRHVTDQESKRPRSSETGWESVAKGFFKGLVKALKPSISRLQLGRWPAYFLNPDVTARINSELSTQQHLDANHIHTARQERDEALKVMDRYSAQLADLDLVEYGKEFDFGKSCQAFLDAENSNEKQRALEAIVLHIDANAELCNNTDNTNTVRTASALWMGGTVPSGPELDELETLVVQMQSSSSSSGSSSTNSNTSTSSSTSSTGSVASSSTDHQIQYGNTAKYAVCCEEFLELQDSKAKLAKLEEVLRHINSEQRKFGGDTGHENKLRTQLLAWQGGMAPTALQIEELNDLVGKLQVLAL